MNQALLESTPRLAALSDEEIVERVRAGETELFEILMRRSEKGFRPSRS